jgi:hypothetical protein
MLNDEPAAPGSFSFDDQRTLAIERLDEIDKVRANAPLQRFVDYALRAFGHAVEIVALSRVPVSVQRFLENAIYLRESANRMVDVEAQKLYKEHWPKNPGIAFSSLASDSALGLATQFSHLIDREVDGALRASMGAQQHQHLPVAPPHTHKLFEVWRDRTCERLQRVPSIGERFPLPEPSSWPLWQIRRDAHSLLFAISAEWAAYRSESSQTSAQRNAHTKTISEKTPREQRDEWLNAQAEKGTPYRQIARDLRSKHKRWPQIGDESGVRQAVTRFRIKFNLPPLPRRQPGKNSGKTRSPSRA